MLGEPVRQARDRIGQRDVPAGQPRLQIACHDVVQDARTSDHHRHVAARGPRMRGRKDGGQQVGALLMDEPPREQQPDRPRGTVRRNGRRDDDAVIDDRRGRARRAGPDRGIGLRGVTRHRDRDAVREPLRHPATEPGPTDPQRRIMDGPHQRNSPDAPRHQAGDRERRLGGFGVDMDHVGTLLRDRPHQRPGGHNHTTRFEPPTDPEAARDAAAREPVGHVVADRVRHGAAQDREHREIDVVTKRLDQRHRHILGATDIEMCDNMQHAQ